MVVSLKRALRHAKSSVLLTGDEDQERSRLFHKKRVLSDNCYTKVLLNGEVFQRNDSMSRWLNGEATHTICEMTIKIGCFVGPTLLGHLDGADRIIHASVS